MVSPLSSRTGTPVKWGQGSKIQKAEKRTAESAMTDGFVEKIKEYAKQDAKQGVYMSKSLFNISGCAAWVGIFLPIKANF